MSSSPTCVHCIQLPRAGSQAPSRSLPGATAMPAAAAETAPAYSPDADARPLLSVRADAGDAAALASLATHGAVILEHALPDDAVAAAAAALAPFLAEVAERWDTEADALQIPWRKWGVTRCPRVNAGKKNVHLDPHGAAACGVSCAEAAQRQPHSRHVR